MVQAEIQYLRAKLGDDSEGPRFVPVPGSLKRRTHATYSEALALISDIDPQAAEAVSTYVRDLRAECAAARVKLRECEKDVAYLEGQLDALSPEGASA
ncbi:hypothetical protein [Microbacterium lacticum]